MENEITEEEITYGKPMPPDIGERPRRKITKVEKGKRKSKARIQRASRRTNRK